MATALNRHPKRYQRKTPSRRERRSTEIRERLYQSALRLFAERGYFETTVEDITNAADVGKGTFFNYFPSKEHVLSTFGDQRLAYFERALESVRRGEASVAASLAATIAELAAVDPSEAALFRSIFAAHVCSDSVCTYFRDKTHRCQRIISEILTAGQQNGEVRRDRSSTEMARILQQTMLGLTMSWALNPEHALDKTSSPVWHALWDTFRAHDADAPVASTAKSKN